MIQKLIFIYNADSGKVNAAVDMLHKIFSPSTYPCSLCAITYGVFAIQEKWKLYIETLHVETEFLHKDDYIAKYGSTSIKLPAVLAVEQGITRLFISAQEMDALTLPGLMAMIDERLGQTAT